MTNLPDAERDACDVVQALGGLAALLSRLEPGDPAYEDARRLLQNMADDGVIAAERVIAYLRALRGAGDGESVAVAPSLGPWRDWVPPRGHLFGRSTPTRRLGEVPQPRRFDPGE